MRSVITRILFFEENSAHPSPYRRSYCGISSLLLVLTSKQKIMSVCVIFKKGFYDARGVQKVMQFDKFLAGFICLTSDSFTENRLITKV